MKKEEKNWCRYGQVIDDARIMLNSIQTWKVNYVRREANGIAHRLAKEALFLLDEQGHMEESRYIVDIVGAGIIPLLEGLLFIGI
jgi:hypothetical protein